MCLGGGGGGSKQAKKIQERNEELEQQRQARIREGASLIDTNFSRFDDNFFNDFKNSFLSFYEPQLDEQSNAARGKLTASLVDRGILESTEGNRTLTDLQKRDALERTNLANRSMDASSDLRSRVEREKSNLYALNETAADPERMAPLVQGSATSLVAPNAFDPIGDVFGSALNNAAAYLAARNNAVAPYAQRTFSSYGVAPTGGSGRVTG